MNKKYYVPAGLIVIALGMSFYSDEKTPIQVDTPMMSANTKETDTRKPASPSKKSSPSITSGELQALRGSFPDKSMVKEEVRNNPHTTPKSLTAFAKRMGPLMEKALTNDVDAGIIINELQDCAWDESVAQAARALCVSNSEKLGRAHPEMKKKAENIRVNASSDVQKLLK